MDLKLNDLTTIVNFLTSANYWGLPLLLSLVLPVFYITFKKLTEKNDEADRPIKSRILRLFTFPSTDTRVMIVCAGCFVIGCFTVVIGTNRHEAIRLNGLKVKAYMSSENYYLKTVPEIQRDIGLDDGTLKDIAETFPTDFVKKHHYYTDPIGKSSVIETVYLTDTVLRKQFITRATKLLDAYLMNDAVMEAGGIKSYASLFTQNPFFTKEVVDQLIIDSSYKYTLNYMSTNDPRKDPGIVRKDIAQNRIKLLDAYLSNPNVLKINNKKPFSELLDENSFFTKEVVEKLIAETPSKYSLILIDPQNVGLGFAIVKK